jgi:hypothetical protein
LVAEWSTSKPSQVEQAGKARGIRVPFRSIEIL